jgi:hypothetical protein
MLAENEADPSGTVGKRFSSLAPGPSTRRHLTRKYLPNAAADQLALLARAYVLGVSAVSPAAVPVAHPQLRPNGAQQPANEARTGATAATFART